MTLKNKLPLLLILLGVGLFVYGVLNFSEVGYSYSTEARLEASLGAMLTVGGSLLYRAKKPN